MLDSQLWEPFRQVVETRRSVRVYDGTPIPEGVVSECIDMALLAPNSSNLQPWEFYWVKDPSRKQKLVEACLSQPTARTAAELIVIVARTRSWRANRKLMLEHFEKVGGVPESAKKYYRKIVPFAYFQGPFGLMGLLKKIAFWCRGLFTPTPREPASYNDMKIWAIKSATLAAQNLMLAIRAKGFDSCPMEGFDSLRVRALLNLPSDAQVALVVSMGKRHDSGIYGPRVRFDRSLYVHVV